MAINYKTKEAVRYQKDFAKYVLEEVERQGWETDLESQRHFYVDGYFYFDKMHRDSNNYWKCMLDAITDAKCLWDDDDIVCERTMKIVYDAANPRVELRIYHVDYIGVFNDEKQYEDFVKSNCVGCNRYKRNCSILRNAVEGRIQEEVSTDCCACKKKNKEKKG